MLRRTARSGALAAVVAVAMLGTPVIAHSVATGADPSPASRPRADTRAVSADTRAASADTPDPRRDRVRILARTERGRPAIEALGTRLPRVAARNGLSPTRLRTILTEDHTSRLSTEGDLYYAEDAPHLTAAQTAAGATAASTVAPAYPTNQTFTLHSRPGSTRTIYLDADGGTVSGTSWNGTTAQHVRNGTWNGLDLDGQPGSFSTAEHGFLQEVWRQVSESYAPFDVDVTTQDPGPAALNRSTTSDQTYGTRVFITSSPEPRQALCPTCVGVAYIASFATVSTTGYYQPAWVFQYSRSFDPMIVAQAATHEAGHNLGLAHDGQGTADYYAGTAAWGPVMGAAMLRAVTQFSRGEYTGASNTQDDLAVIAAHGLALRADDHPSSTGVAEQLGAHPSYVTRGVIGTRNDTDVFALTLPCTTTLDVAAVGIGRQSALDLALTVRNAAGTVVATSSPTSGYAGSPPASTGMNAAASVPGASGTYFLTVDGVGNGDPTGTGWSDYGSVGQYTLSASGCPADSTSTVLPTPTPTPTPTVGPTSGATASPTPTPTPGPTAASSPTASGTPVGPATPTASPTAAPTPVRTAPSAPRVGYASWGNPGGLVTAVARWAAPSRTGGSPVTRYRVAAMRVDRHGRVVSARLSSFLSPRTHVLALRLPRGQYRFKVLATNAIGVSPWSALSRTVLAR